MRQTSKLKLMTLALWALLAAGCGVQSDASADPLTVVPGPSSQTVEEQKEPAGSGTVELTLEEGTLTAQQEQLLRRFMDGYYTALARLTGPEETTDLFASESAEENGWAGLRFQLGLRTMTEGADYSLCSWSYVLRCTSVEQGENGTVIIEAEEDSTQIFAQTPDIESRRYGIYHRFTLSPEPEGWRIAGHTSFDALYLTLIRRGGWENLEARYAAQVPAFLEENRVQAAARREQNEEVSLPAADHSYDRQGALDYAVQYSNDRNDDWANYEGLGGNCQNYVSQCLLAGGIPMDTQGDAVWKWYGDTVANDQTASGRSSSWSGVDEFLAYAAGNRGYGLAALTDAPYETGQPGDLIQMGEGGDWRHVVIISRPVQDTEGRTIDYLVCSNTSDLENWPASLYGYPELALTRIAGWND